MILTSVICTWAIALVAIAGVILRPFKTPEWWWAIGGAMVLTLTGLLPVARSLNAIGDGASVYFFLIGMMLLSELAREEKLFDWLAGTAAQHSNGSSFRLFVFIYIAGIFTTAFLSLDATAVVLTPAVLAASRRAGAKATVHLFACALISNAASFILPISNPANLVIYGGTPPGVLEWLRDFGLPSLAAILATFLVLLIWFRQDLATPLQELENAASPEDAKLKPGAKVVGYGLVLVIAVMLIYSYLGRDFGVPAFVAALVVATLSSLLQRKSPVGLLKSISWSVIPLVAGLFVLVEGLNGAGAQKILIDAFVMIERFTEPKLVLAIGFGIGTLTDVLNNLPVGLMVSGAVKHFEVSAALRKALLLGVDLGPNLSVTGSLATILWLLAIRREGENVRARDFFKIGLVAMPIAMGLALMALLI